MPSPLENTHFKGVVETITVWLPKTLTDLEAEQLLAEIQDSLDGAVQAVADYVQEHHPDCMVQ